MVSVSTKYNSITAFAPATCSNVAVGFDILGFALENIGDHVTLTKRNDKKIVIESINSKDSLSFDANKNTASIVIQKFCEDLNLNTGFSIHIEKGIPICSGMGGSAASAVAALVACNAFLDTPLTQSQLVQYALYGEEFASGQKHADNIVPCLFGGLTLIHSLDPIELIQLPIPDIYCVLIHPHLQVATKEARKILKDSISLENYVKQSAKLAGFISALYQNNQQLLEKFVTDLIIEPQRSHLVPGFYHVKEAALAAGAFGVSFSGSGPSIFALVTHIQQAESVTQAMRKNLQAENIQSDYWISKISSSPARVTHQS